MSDRQYLDYIYDILDSIEKIESFTSNMDYAAFAADDKTVYAVVRALEVIGEAAKKIPDEARKQYPDIPWQKMAGARDKLIHEYFGINIKVVWKTVQESLPPLKPAIAKMIADMK